MLTILAVGEDFDLLKTRADILRKTGANVLCSSGAAAIKFISEWEFDLVVLSHSVRQEDAEQIADVAHRSGSKTQVLLLVSGREQDKEFNQIPLDGRSFVDPACLLRSVTQLLARQGKHRRPEMPPKKQNISIVIRKKPASFPADIAARRKLTAQFEDRRAS